MCSDNSAMNLRGQVCLLSEWLAEVTADDCFNERHELASKVVRSFLGHLSWQVVHTREENVCGSQVVVNLLLEGVVDGVVEKEGLLDASEPACELN